ncbi:MAG TPA: rhomboid family intramembrane serine protease [Pyrinomonadaceae bacterium]|nr:rhomboid family intramembrane serine protease [Pyrinomonadaceae bacterium]
MAERDTFEGARPAGRPSLCRDCGAIVGAGEQACSACGAAARRPAPERPAVPQPDPATARFVRAIINRPATFTFVFLIANVFLYLMMSFDGGATGNVLVAYGAKLNALINERGEWWRFVTPIFLHVQMPALGPLHLLTNMYGLFMLGPYVEKLYGSAKFVVFWIACGVAGVAASYLAVQPELAASGALGRFLFKVHDVPSAGASGALFGLVGVLFVFGIKYRSELPEGLKRAFGTGMLPIILINLFIGYAGSGFIDNAAHLGGLVSGMALALCVGYKRIGPRGPVAYAWHFLQAACLLLVAASFLMAARNFHQPLPAWQPPGFGLDSGEPSNIVAFTEAVNAGQGALRAFIDRGQAEALAPAAEQLGRTPSVNEGADALRDDLKALVERARGVSAERDPPEAERRRRTRQLREDLNDWSRRFAEWVRTDGKALNLIIEEAKPEAEPARPGEEK